MLLALVMSATIYVKAGITTYTFTSEKWASQVGATKCDGKTDGWVSDKDASSYSAKQPYVSAVGAKVETGASGAGATSVKEFNKVRKITINFAQNSSKGKGVVFIQVGDNNPDSLIINKPAKSGEGSINRDSDIIITGEPSGKIKFWIKCTENAIYLNTLTVRSQDGGSPFTQASYQLVTDVKQLKDSDQIIFGVAKSDYIMGYFDEYVSKNNIAAIKGKYTDDRQTVAENEAAVYTLWLMQHEVTGDSFYVFVDEIRYEQAFLVASGGATKNRLAIWDDYTSSAYGDYGVWDVDIDVNGEATIMSMGTSKGKYMQLNGGSPTGPIFACYQNQNYEKVCLYRRVEAIGDSAAIVAPMCNFGVVTISGDIATGSKTIQINANKLTEDISCTLKNGSTFSLSSATIDRDGDNLTISYKVSAAGKYIDTLVLTSGTVKTEALIILDVQPVRTIAEVTTMEDYATVYLNPVVVTKKFNKYVFIRDETGSMLIWDATNPKTGKPYAQDLKNGDQLIGVQGVYQNYFGVPELSPTAAWTVAAKSVVTNPDTVLTVDSADVCRYVCMERVTVENSLWQGVPVVNAFQTGEVIEDVSTTLDAIVMIDHDILQLWVVKQDYTPTDMEAVQNEECSMQNGKYLRNGQLFIRTNGDEYNMNGHKCNK